MGTISHFSSVHSWNLYAPLTMNIFAPLILLSVLSIGYATELPCKEDDLIWINPTPILNNLDEPPSSRVANVELCKSMCTSNGACEAWTFTLGNSYESGGECDLWSDVGTEGVVDFPPGMAMGTGVTSGFKRCA